MVHALRNKPSERNKRMAIKTDMSKAYDRMEWSFIEAVMRKMGFSEIWINWIMRCITSVKYKVLMNGQPRENNVPERGLRQGDPLSPFIFILCTEALVSLLNHAENQGKITGMEVMKVVRRYGKASGQCINFDKSSLLFGKRINANVRQQIKDIQNFRMKEE
ncbi:secreted RxLR effector protein 78-like [Brassica napus]|uniref:secreted RxLR effector protein 78-like n=1 Tax=Brassica napus TaxID=3708 RepID=UPI00207A9C16|nr:secreted RxLR effector protein 78-like [Brassica napus]